MEQVRMTQNEYIVLRAYNEVKDGDYKNLNQMAEYVGVQYAPFKRVVDKLRAKELLTGQRKIVISPEGAQVYLEATEFLKQESVAQEEPSNVDPSAAAVMSNQPAVHTQEPERRMLSDIVASRLNVEPSKLWKVIRDNVISYNPEREPAPTDEEVMHVLSVMNKYDLDPFVKQIHAFRHKGKLQVVVGVDGWIAVADRRPQFRGVEYEFPPMEEMVTTPSGKKCWPWVKATCYVEGRKPTVAYAFLDEWYTTTKWGDSAWENYPTHRLKQKAYTMSIREGLGIALYDDADREQFFIMKSHEKTRIEAATTPTAELTEQIKTLNPGFVEDDAPMSGTVFPNDGEPHHPDVPDKDYEVVDDPSQDESDPPIMDNVDALFADEEVPDEHGV